GVVAAAFEEALAPRHFLWLDLFHETRGLRLRDEGGAWGLKRRVAEMVVAVEMAVDHPFDRLVREIADAPQQILAVARVLARVDHQHSVAGGENGRIRRAELEQEVKVGSDLFEDDRAARTLLRGCVR